MEQLIESYPVPCGHTSTTHWVAVKYDEDRDTRVLWYLLDVISQFVQSDRAHLAHALISVAEHEGRVTVTVNPDHYNGAVHRALEASCGERMGAGDDPESVAQDQWILDVVMGETGGDSCY